MNGNTRRTDDECILCDDGTYLQSDHVRFCDTCHYTPSMDEPGPRTELSEWEHFRRERRKDKYSGWYGEDRVKFVGGFLGPWNAEEL